MHYADVIQYFMKAHSATDEADARRRAAKLLNVTHAALSQWKKSGLVPKVRALELDRKTHSKLKYDESDYPKRSAVEAH